MLIYVHGANDPESRLPAGLLDIGVSKRQIAVISKTDMPCYVARNAKVIA